MMVYASRSAEVPSILLVGLLVMDDVAQICPADFTQAAVDPDAFLDITIPAGQPGRGMQKRLCPFLRHSFPLTLGKNKKACTTYRFMRYMAQALRHRHFGNIHDGLSAAAFAVNDQVFRLRLRQKLQHFAASAGRTAEPPDVCCYSITRASIRQSAGKSFVGCVHKLVPPSSR